MKFDNETIRSVTRLVYYHDYRMPPDKRSVRRAVNRIGKELFPYYLEIRMADTLAQSAYRREEKIADIRGVEQCFYKILRDGECVSLKEMAVTGKDLIGAGIKPGPQMGEILNTLLEEVLEDPKKNQKAYLLERTLNVYEEK